MNNDQRQAVWRESIEKYGKETQNIVCMEECAELIQAISKLLRGQDTPEHRDNLAEEMADVTICLRLLQIMWDVSGAEIDRWITTKTYRQSKRLDAAETKETDE